MLQRHSLLPMIALWAFTCPFGQARAQPIVQWVTPPAWHQASNQHGPLMPGQTLNGQTTVITGRGASALIAIGQEYVLLDENSAWEISPRNSSNMGDVIQGNVQTGSSARAKLLHSDISPYRLHPLGSWQLAVDLGRSEEHAKSVHAYLQNSGYPVQPISRIERFWGDRWESKITGYETRQAAQSSAQRLSALLPGGLEIQVEEVQHIVSPSTPQQ